MPNISTQIKAGTYSFELLTVFFLLCSVSATSQLPGTSPYLHNGVTPQDPPRSNDLRNPPNHQSDLRIPSHQSDLRIPSHQSDLRIPSHQSSDRSYLYAQSQRYPASYR